MGFLNLNLYRHPSEKVFDARKVIAKIQQWFPEADILPGDPTADEVRRAEERSGPDSKVVASLRRKAQSYGPGRAFHVPQANGQPIRGLARSVGVGFLFDDPLPEPVRQRLITFLTSLGVGRLEASVPDRRQSIVLADLNGPSDCLRDQPGVPWHPVPNPEPAHSADTP